MLAPGTPTMSGSTAREIPQEPTRARGQSHWNYKLRGQQGACTPFEPPLTGGHLCLTPIIYKSFIMPGTHSEPHRGQMSHICDINLLRVKSFSVEILVTFHVSTHYCIIYQRNTTNRFICLIWPDQIFCKRRTDQLTSILQEGQVLDKIVNG